MSKKKKLLTEPFPQEFVVGMYCSETLTHEGLIIALTLNEKGIHKMGGG